MLTQIFNYLVLLPFFTVMSISAIALSPAPKSVEVPCKQVVETSMGKLCLYSDKSKDITNSYLFLYTEYLLKHFEKIFHIPVKSILIMF